MPLDVPHMRLNSPLLPILVGALLVLQLVAPHAGWAMLLAGLGGAWAVAFGWARSLRGGLHLRREMRFGWAQVGDQFEERFTLHNTGWAPALWVEVEDHSTLPDYQASIATGVGAEGESQWRTRSLHARRGVWRLGPTTLRAGDPFGLYTVTIPLADTASLLVLPPTVPLPAIQIAAGGPAGDGRPRAYAPDQTASAALVRPYAPGDSPRWVHWPTSARQGALWVRRYDGAPVGDWHIVLDLEQRVQVGEGDRSTVEAAVILAASLAERGLRAGRAVGLAAHGVAPLWLAPRRGEAQRLAIGRALAQAEAGSVSLADLLTRAEATLRRPASLIVISPDMEGRWVSALLPLRRRGVVPTVLLLDPASFGAAEDEQAASLLAEWGVAHFRVTRDMVHLPAARPGQQGQWGWRTLATGRVIATRPPRDLRWRELG